MGYFGFLSFVCCYILVQLHHAAAPPPPVIEAYKPKAQVMSFPDTNSGFGTFDKLNKMLTKLQHQIDDINVRRKIMEAQMQSRFSSLLDRIEPGLQYLDTSAPSVVYMNKRIMSADGRFLQIFEDGKANGTSDDSSPHTNITLEMVGVKVFEDGKGSKDVSSSMFLIKGGKSKKYLACDEKGRFQAVSQKSDTIVFSSRTPPQPLHKKRHRQLWKTNKWVNIICEKHQFLLGFRHNNEIKKGRHSRADQLNSWFSIL